MDAGGNAHIAPAGAYPGDGEIFDHWARRVLISQ